MLTVHSTFPKRSSLTRAISCSARYSWIFQCFLDGLWTQNHLYPWFRCNRYWKIHNFWDMPWLWAVINFFLERVGEKSGTQMRVSARRSFDCAYFQLHRITPSLSNPPLLSGNFGIFGFRDVSVPNITGVEDDSTNADSLPDWQFLPRHEWSMSSSPYILLEVVTRRFEQNAEESVGFLCRQLY